MSTALTSTDTSPDAYAILNRAAQTYNTLCFEQTIDPVTDTITYRDNCRWDHFDHGGPNTSTTKEEFLPKLKAEWRKIFSQAKDFSDAVQALQASPEAMGIVTQAQQEMDILYERRSLDLGGVYNTIFMDFLKDCNYSSKTVKERLLPATATEHTPLHPAVQAMTDVDIRAMNALALQIQGIIDSTEVQRSPGLLQQKVKDAAIPEVEMERYLHLCQHILQYQFRTHDTLGEQYHRMSYKYHQLEQALVDKFHFNTNAEDNFSLPEAVAEDFSLHNFPHLDRHKQPENAPQPLPTLSKEKILGYCQATAGQIPHDFIHQVRFLKRMKGNNYLLVPSLIRELPAFTDQMVSELSAEFFPGITPDFPALADGYKVHYSPKDLHDEIKFKPYCRARAS